MEENNKRIEEIKNQISKMNEVFETDFSRGKNEINDQLQANRQKKINELNEELKEVEIEKLSKLEERKVELEGILKKKESLNKDKEQLEQAIYEMSGEKTSAEAKEYERDLGKVNAELASLEPYELELKNVDLEIDKISNKYNLIDYSDRKMTLNEWRERAAFEIPYKDYKYNSDEKITLQDFYKRHVEEDWSDLLLYARMAPDTREFFKKYFPNKVMEKSAYFVDSCIKGLKDDIQKGRVDYKNQANLIWWMDTLESIPSVDHDIIKACNIQLKENQGNKNFDIDKLSDIQEKLKGIKEQAILGKEAYETNHQIGKSEDEKLVTGDAKLEEKLEENNKTEDNKEVQEEKYDRSAPKIYNNYEKTNLSPNNEVNYTQGTYNENRYQPSQNNNNQINKEETAITKYKKDNRIIAWIKDRFNGIKEKFNSVKERFSKSKNNKEEVELNEVGEAWQDYIDMQEGKPGKESKAKRFKEGLQVKGQQLKQSEIARKLTRQNEKDKKANQSEAAKDDGIDL